MDTDTTTAISSDTSRNRTHVTSEHLIDNDDDITTANLPSPLRSIKISSSSFFKDVQSHSCYHGQIISDALKILSRVRGHYFLAAVMDAEEIFGDVQDRLYFIIVGVEGYYFMRRLKLREISLPNMAVTQVAQFFQRTEVFYNVQELFDFVLANELDITGEEGVMTVPLKRFSWQFDIKQNEAFKIHPTAEKYFVRSSQNKCLPKDVVLHRTELTPKNSQKVFNELSILSKLSHPNIIHFFGFSAFRYIGIMTEFFSTNLELFYRYEKNDRYFNSRTKVLVQTADALRYLKANGIVHRRVECVNVLLDKQDNAKLSNFTFSGTDDEKPLNPKLLCRIPFRKQPDFVYRETTITEVPVNLVRDELQDCRYLAPESINREVFSCQSDVYQFALLLYEIATRRKFMHYYAGPDYQIFDLIASSEKWVKLPKKTPESVKKLFLKCISKSPSDRPSIEHVYNVLHQLLLVERFFVDNSYA